MAHAFGLSTVGTGAVAPAPGLPGTDCSLDGRICVGSSCAVTCPGTQIECGGVCIEPSTDASHCGATAGCGVGGTGSSGTICSSTVGTGAVCAGSTCACPSGHVDCGAACIDPTSNRNFCGASGVCTPGAGSAGTDGIDCALDGRVCVGSACAVTCPGTQIACGGGCIEPSSDETYCGASGSCGAGGGSIGIDCIGTIGTGALFGAAPVGGTSNGFLPRKHQRHDRHRR